MKNNTRTTTDYGTPELHKQHVINHVKTSDGRRVAIVRSTCPIDYYYHRSIITPQQYDAANILYRLWYYGAEKSSYVTVRDPREPSGEPNYEAKMELEQKYNNAMKELPVMVRLIIYNVVCLGEWAKYIKASVGRDRRMVLLHKGLDQLAKHFRIS